MVRVLFLGRLLTIVVFAEKERQRKAKIVAAAMATLS